MLTPQKNFRQMRIFDFTKISILALLPIFRPYQNFDNGQERLIKFSILAIISFFTIFSTLRNFRFWTKFQFLPNFRPYESFDFSHNFIFLPYFRRYKTFDFGHNSNFYQILDITRIPEVFWNSEKIYFSFLRFN